MPRAAGPVLVALVAVLVIAPSAMAAKADRHDVTYTELRCDDLQSEAGHARVSVWTSDGGDAYADLAYWAAPANPEQSGPTWYGYSNTAVIADDGSTIDISIDVYEDGPSDPSEEPYDLPFVGAGDAGRIAHHVRRGGGVPRSGPLGQPQLPGDRLVPVVLGRRLARASGRSCLRPWRLPGVEDRPDTVQQPAERVGRALEHAPPVVQLGIR